MSSGVTVRDGPSICWSGDPGTSSLHVTSGIARRSAARTRLIRIGNLERYRDAVERAAPQDRRSTRSGRRVVGQLDWCVGEVPARERKPPVIPEAILRLGVELHPPLLDDTGTLLVELAARAGLTVAKDPV